MTPDPIKVRHGFAQSKRAEIRKHAHEIGIDQAFLSDLVEQFYTRIRAHDRLGPVFADRITDWAPHLARMKQFWASVALNSGDYSGRPVPIHQQLTNVKRSDFALWLGLFQATLDDIAPTPAANAYMMERASRIARNLEMAMFDRFVLPDRR